MNQGQPPARSPMKRRSSGHDSLRTDQVPENSRPEEGERPAALEHLEERLVELKQAAETLLATLDRTTGDLGSALETRMRQQPYGVLAAAVAAGYVCGGGLPSRLTRMALALGGRIGMEYVWRELSARLLAGAGAASGQIKSSPTEA